MQFLTCAENGWGRVGQAAQRAVGDRHHEEQAADGDQEPREVVQAAGVGALGEEGSVGGGGNDGSEVSGGARQPYGGADAFGVGLVVDGVLQGEAVQALRHAEDDHDAHQLPYSAAGVQEEQHSGGCVTAGVVGGNIVKSSFRQRYCPPRVLGRATASSAFLNYGTIPLGALAAGWLGTVLDLRTAVWITTAGIPLAALILVFSPIRHVRDLPAALQPARRPPGSAGRGEQVGQRG